MRAILTSGGLEFGPQEGPWIDVIPLPGRRPVEPGEVGRIAKDNLLWQRWSRKEVRELGFPVLVPAGMSGIIGVSEVHNAAIRFLWKRGQSPTQALREIEESEGRLSPALAGALLVAASAREYPVTQAPAAVAIVCDLLPSEGPTRYSRREIQDFAALYIGALVGERTDVLIPGGATDRARFWLQVARRLWEPETRRRVARAPVDLENRVLVTMLTTGWAELKRVQFVEVDGLRLHVAAFSGAWPHLMEWEHTGVPAKVLDFLVGDQVPVGVLTPFFAPLLMEPPEGPSIDESLARGLVEAFLEEATENAVYAPAGEFVLSLPDEYPLRREWGMKALRVWADPEGLWVAGLDIRDEVLFALRWRPDRPASGSWVVVGEPAVLLDVTLAALWRDLRVAGEEAVPPAPRRRGTRASSVPPTRRARRGTGQRVYALPRRRRSIQRLPLSGTRTWGTRDDRAYVQEAREVPGHTRRLPPGWKASEEAKQRAQLAGIILPAGHTYVRPHPRRVWVRADAAFAVPREGERQRRARTVKARGLVTVMVLLGHSPGSVPNPPGGGSEGHDRHGTSSRRGRSDDTGSATQPH